MRLKVKFIIGILCIGLCLLVLGGVGIYKKSTSNDVELLKEEAFVFDTAYTYGVGVLKAGDYQLVVKGDKLNDVSIKVNGILQNEEPKGNKTTVSLNKGINSITFDNGSKINKVIIKKAGDFNSYGAFVSYDSVEAEDCETNGKVSEEDRTYRTFASEASGRKYVELNNTGDYLVFPLKQDANALVIRYCIPDSEDGNGLTESLHLEVGGDKKDILVTSKYSWVYGAFPWNNDPSSSNEGGGHRFFDDVRVTLDKTYAAGTKVRILKDESDKARYYLIDCIETEEVDKPLPMPENALNVMDFGAIPDDSIDDAEAISACIKEAVLEKKEVYIPEGVFEIGNPVFINGFVLRDNDVTIRGAGMWHTVLHGNAAAFTIRAGNISFYDFSLLGEVNRRRDSIDPPAFSMITPVKGMENIHIQNIWMEHWKVGLWADVTNGIDIMGCRIRNTFADGINLCGGTSNCVVTQNDIRNTGDDGIALFNRGVLEENNKIINNTVALPWLANNIALYGGKDIVVKGNWLKDTICFGGGVNISTNFNPQVFEGSILVEDNKFERCGSKENNINADYGAVWVNTVEGFDNTANCVITNNIIFNSSYQGISFFNTGLLNNMVIKDNQINGCGTYGYEVAKDARGFAIINNNHITDAKLGEYNINQNQNFEIRKK